MKKIRKVTVTPMADNIGTIIDNLNTTDDQTTNAPSIHAVNTALGNKANSSDVYVKGDFAIITGTITMPPADDSSVTGTEDINYPTGFNASNCVVISVMSQRSDQSGYATTISASEPASSVRGNGQKLFFRKKSKIRLRNMRSVGFPRNTVLSQTRQEIFLLPVNGSMRITILRWIKPSPATSIMIPRMLPCKR